MSAVIVLSGTRTLLYKEVLRFWKVSFQTVAAPVLTAVLYLLIFGHVLQGHVKVYDRISYTAFLVPGLVMMSVLQNAFANSSSSLIQSKITGNLVFVLLPPLSHWEMFGAYVVASVILSGGIGLMMSPATQSMLSTLPPHRTSMGSAVSNSTRNGRSSNNEPSSAAAGTAKPASKSRTPRKCCSANTSVGAISAP